MKRHEAEQDLDAWRHEQAEKRWDELVLRWQYEAAWVQAQRQEADERRWAYLDRLAGESETEAAEARNEVCYGH